MVLNETVQTLRDAEELKQRILKFKTGTSMLQERNLWTTQQQLQKLYQKLLVLDLDYALDKKVEQDLWSVGFKLQIEALQAVSKDRKNAQRSDGQQMLSWVLQAASGFYLCLLHQICTAFKLDLPFRRRASLLGLVESWGAGGGDARTPPPAAALYICQHCLVHLGDLARYRQQLRVAHSFYRHALLVSAHSGQPYNQLALVSWRRGRRLGALYWHVRSLLVRAPFPPAPANLTRTLAAAAAHTSNNTEELPVLPGVIEKPAAAPGKLPASAGSRLTAHSLVGELIRAYHLIHTLDDLETASQLVNTLNSSLTALVATDSFESMTLVKMACITIWLVGSATEELQVGAAGLTAAEGAAAALATALAAGAIVSLLLCSHDHTALSLPALKVYLEWAVGNPQLLRDAAFLSRPQLWPALAHTLNALAQHTKHFDGHDYDAVPLPEDEELHGFLPLEKALSGLKFSKYASWETYGDRIPDMAHNEVESLLSSPQHTPLPDREAKTGDSEVEQLLESDPELASSLRAWRLVRLGRRIVNVLHQNGADYLQISTENDWTTFTAPQSSPELLRALEELSVVRDSAPDHVASDTHHSEEESEDDDDRPLPPPPVIISEADFREKVREKRVGILKPQGSLERAREERALIAATQDNQQVEQETAAVSEKREEAPRAASARTRTNVAMQAILRVQEESSKQVKFVTPATTPDSTLDPLATSPVKEAEKTKILQPKAIKSLANLPIGKKTGGILSLKDKSAGYPHLQNADPEPPKKSEDTEKGKKPDSCPSVKLNQSSSQSSQQNAYHPTPYSGKLRMEHHQHPPALPSSWPTPGAQPSSSQPAPYNEPPSISYTQQKNYNLQNMPVHFNTLYSQQHHMSPHSQSIRLPVVNPKEIDVRSAALQKQYSRPELFSDGSKPVNQNWNVSGDKKTFLNDLPPRFANQFRHWSGTPADQQGQYGILGSQENKFRDDAYKSNMMFGNNNFQSSGHPAWPKPPLPSDNPPQPSYNWWSSDGTTGFNPNYPPPSTIHPTFYPQSMTGGNSNPYQTSNYNQMNNIAASQQQGFSSKPNDNSLSVGSNFMQNALSQPQTQSLQNLMKSPNYNATMSSFGNYNQSVNYDPSMYPQFTSNKLGYQPPPTKMGEKPLSYGLQKNSMELGHGLGLGSNIGELRQHSHLAVDLTSGALNDDVDLMKNLDSFGLGERESGAEGGNTYSLFSAGEETMGAGWGGVHLPTQHHQQSLWSGPGPSPLERLLEQQKQLNKTSGEQQ